MKCIYGASLVAQLVKNLPSVQETRVWSLGWEDSLQKGMATHSTEGNGYPLQHSCLENPHGQRSLAGYPVHAVTKSRTQLSDKAQHNTIHLSSQTMEENRESLIKWYSETESYSSSSIFKWNITSNALDFFPTFWFRWRLPPSLSFPGPMVICCTD